MSEMSWYGGAKPEKLWVVSVQLKDDRFKHKVYHTISTGRSEVTRMKNDTWRRVKSVQLFEMTVDGLIEVS